MEEKIEEPLIDYLSTGNAVILEEINYRLKDKLSTIEEQIKDQIVDDTPVTNDEDITEVNHRMTESLKAVEEIRELIRPESDNQ